MTTAFMSPRRKLVTRVIIPTCLAEGFDRKNIALGYEYISLLDCHAAKEVLGWQPQYSQFDPESGYAHK